MIQEDSLQMARIKGVQQLYNKLTEMLAITTTRMDEFESTLNDESSQRMERWVTDSGLKMATIFITGSGKFKVRP